MDLKNSTDQLYEKILPYAKQEAGQTISQLTNPYDNLILKKIKSLITKDYQELMENIDDVDVQGSFKIKLRRLLKEDQVLQKLVELLLKEAQEYKPSIETTNMTGNKTAFKDTQIEVGRDLKIGDDITNNNEQNTIDKQTKIDKIEGNDNVHIGDIINIYEMSEKEQNKKGDINKIAEKANQLIAKNKIKRALELLLIHSKDLDEDIYTHIVQQSQRWNKLKMEELSGTIKEGKARIISNRITYGLLEMINELKDLEK